MHLRCPGNVGLLAVIAQVFFPKKKKTVKYAGNWDPKASQPWSYRLQKWILSNTFLSRNIKVLVYGEWPGQSRNIVPFFTASFSENDREQVSKEFKTPYRFIYTGNLVEGKGLAEAIELIASLRARELDCRLDIYGDGKLEGSLKKLVQENRLQEFIRFHGRVRLEDLKEAYRKAHFSVLLSRSEGWPKAIAEAMWFGCVPVTSSVSCLPWMLKAPSAPEGGTVMTRLGLRGILVPDPRFMVQNSKFKIQGSTFNVQGSKFKVQRFTDIGEKVLALIENPEEYRKMSFEAQEWSQSYTLEKFENSIRKLV
ncbi:glycosyltransferase family 4 protein [Salegentibacter sp. HM20]